MFTVDFETYPIEGNPSINPPKPVGVAIKFSDGKSKYLAWGHPTENNCTWEDARDELARIWDYNLLFHNAKFDTAVAEKWMELPIPEPLNIHDTMYLLFLDNPYSDTLSLKPNAERLLDMPPEERDRLTEWIMANTDCPKESVAGAYIYLAPGDLVGEYAIGDVDRTKGLFDLLAPRIKENLMWEAYEREQLLMPIMLKSEQHGVRVDRDRLARDIEIYDAALLQCEDQLRSILKSDTVDFDKGKDIAFALMGAGLCEEQDFLTTPKGRLSTSKESLKHAFQKTDPTVLNLLNYRGSVASALRTFAKPWFDLSRHDGRIHTTWNQVRYHHEGQRDSHGSRTGRLSGSKPSLMNVTNEIKGTIPDNLPEPPLMRRYLLPEEGHYWVKRDFSSQEVRMLAHFEDADLMIAYNENPDLDPHQMAAELIQEITGIEFTRKDTKITAFGIIYGMGVNALAGQLGRPHHEAALVKDAYLRVFPGVKKLQRLVSARGRQGLDIRTWGGRMYYREPSKVVNGRKMDFSYKLLNYLIQGSSADQTKQCLIDWIGAKPDSHIFLATVHDELNISVPKEEWESGMELLKRYMNQDLFDVPMRSEGFYGDNWYDLTECP